MKAYFDKLNLRPHERRLVVIVGLIFFLVINFWFVLPQFSEWNQVSGRMDLERKNLAKFQTEIAKRPQYETRLAELQGGGSEFLTNDLQFLRLVQGQYNIAKLQVSQTRVRPAGTGSTPTQFYQELALDMSYTSGGNELIDFLVGLAAQNYMVRVREMNVRPDPSQTRLMGSLVLVGNLQTNVAGPAIPKPASPAKTNAAPAAATTKPGTNRPALTPLSNKATNRPANPPPQSKLDPKRPAGATTAKAATNNPGSRPPAVRPGPPASKTAALTNRTDI